MRRRMAWDRNGCHVDNGQLPLYIGRKTNRPVGKLPMNLNLKDKVVVITGGGAGIGHATAAAFRAEGAKVVVWDVVSEPKVDVTSKASVESAAAAVISEHGRIDVLVNNAGIVRDAQLVKWKDGEVL